MSVRTVLSVSSLAALGFAVASSSFSAPADAKITKYMTGNAADVAPALHGPVMDLGGGGTDVDAAFQATIDKVRGCTGAACAAKIDIVILRATGADGYNPYLYAMNGVDSVESIVLTKRAEASDPAIVAAVQKAEFVFFAGGDQCNYTTLFKGTPIEDATRAVYNRGGAVGGTSAGLAIMGEYVYDSCGGSATSAEALANPYARSMTFTYDFLDFPYMNDIVTDQHFVVRDRMGRLMAFLARQIKDGKTSTAWGLAVNEETSVVVNPDGTASVVGVGPAYLVLADHAPEQCVAKKPLTYSNFKLWKFPAGATIDLANRPTTGYYTVSATNGVLSSNPY
jgi:cyanophycinase